MLENIRAFVLKGPLLGLVCTGIAFGSGCAPMNIESQSNSSTDTETAFLCVDENNFSQPTNYPLSRLQYMNTIEDLFNDKTLEASASALDTLMVDTHNEQTSERTTSLSSSKIKAYSEVATKVVSHVTSDASLRTKVFGSCATDLSQFSESCLSAFLEGYAVKILRRPLRSDEVAFAKELFNSASKPSDKLALPLKYLLLSPSFIWRIELGSEEEGSSDKLRLTSYELASKLSYLLTDSTPDEQLLELAKSKQIFSPRILKEQAIRLIRSKRGQVKAIKMVFNWSRSGKVADLQSLPAALTSGIELSGLETAMVDEAKAFTKHIIFEKNGSLRDLINSKSSFAQHAGLAKIYGHTPYDGSAVRTMAGERKGLLLRAPFMSTATSRTSIIHRGVDFQEAVLCNTLPSPDDVDIDVNRDEDAFTEEEKALNPNRVNIAHQTRSETCMACHSIINPTGFAFEIFDSLGRIRQEEKVFDRDTGQFISSHIVDASGEVPLTQNTNIPVMNAFDLVNYVGESSQSHACFVRKVYRAMHEDSESSEDNCHLREVFEKNYSQNKPIIEVIAETALGPGFRYKVVKD